MEGLTGKVELGGELDKDIGDLVLSHSLLRPVCKAFQELFGCHQKLGHRRLYRIHLIHLKTLVVSINLLVQLPQVHANVFF